MMKGSQIISFFVICFFITCGQAGNGGKLHFNESGLYKIAQFTDIHWNHHSPACNKTIETIEYVLRKEQPDLVVITGDVVTEAPAMVGWLRIASIFEKAKIPWTVTFGNHDFEAEKGVTKEMIFERIKDLPYFIGEKGPDISGIGNYVLPVYDRTGTYIAALLYCLDSQEYPSDRMFGSYDWIKYDQIAWYRETSNAYTVQNDGIPLPALAFFHIPLPEYKELTGENAPYGNALEGVASPDINSGIFCSMVEKGDVMGVFTGHDHNNDYIGIYKSIALAFGRVTGWDAYGKLERGARIISLYENKQKFDIWITTPSGSYLLYYYPSGLTREEEETMEYLSATPVIPATQGVQYSYYEGYRFRHTSDIKGKELVKTGITQNFFIDQALSEDSMAFVFNCWIKIPERGIYSFYTWSDDGSRLEIDQHLVVDNDGSHSALRADGKVALEAGFHTLKLWYFQDYMGKKLEVGFSSVNREEGPIPSSWLYLPE